MGGYSHQNAKFKVIFPDIKTIYQLVNGGSFLADWSLTNNWIYEMVFQYIHVKLNKNKIADNQE